MAMATRTTTKLTRMDLDALQWFRTALSTGEAQERRRVAGIAVHALARMVGAPEPGTLRKWESLRRTPQDSELAARVARFYLALPEVGA